MSKVTASPPTTNCPTIELSFSKSDGTPIDTSVFTVDSASIPTSYGFSTQSNDDTKIGSYIIKVSAKYTGATYSPATLQFIVDITSPCVTLTDPGQSTTTSPAQYNYNGASVSFVVATPGVPHPQCTISYACAVTTGPTDDFCGYSGGSTTTAAFDTLTGSLAFSSTENQVYGSQIVSFEITATSGTASLTIPFTMELLDPCDNQVLDTTGLSS